MKIIFLIILTLLSVSCTKTECVETQTVLQIKGCMYDRCFVEATDSKVYSVSTSVPLYTNVEFCSKLQEVVE